MDSQADNSEAAKAADEAWQRERREAAIARIVNATPIRYRKSVPIPETARQWLTKGFEADGLAIVGLIGRGKTHLAWQTAKAWAAACLDQPGARYLPTVVAHRATELFDTLRPDAPDNPYKVLERAKNAGLLILDDIAAAKPSEWTQERLYELIDERYVQQRPLLLTADVPPAKLANWVGPRVASRLTEMCAVQVLNGPDYRRGGEAA